LDTLRGLKDTGEEATKDDTPKEEEAASAAIPATGGEENEHPEANE